MSAAALPAGFIVHPAGSIAGRGMSALIAL